MNTFWNKKRLLAPIFGLLVLFGAFFFSYTTTEAASDSLPINFFQCSRHGGYSDCAERYDSFPKSIYTDAAISYQFLGHRHGASDINATICLFEDSGGNVTCDQFSCAGGQCGFEYGGSHPFNLFRGNSITRSSTASDGTSGFYMWRDANVNDAEVQISAEGLAQYADDPVECVPDGSCNAPSPACETITSGVDNCNNSCSKTGPVPCSCVSNGSCSAAAPACGTTTNGVDNCGASCSKVGSACSPGPTPPPPAGTVCGPMTINSGVRGCANLNVSSPVYKLNESACLDYCNANGADACEWQENGRLCYVETGTGCYVQGGFNGWYAATATCPAPPPPVGTPSCSAATPDDFITTATSGTHRVYARDVVDSTSVAFAVWTETGGQDDVVWYAGINAGGGIWYADANLASHPELGTVIVHVYMNPGPVFCDYANFTRTGVSTPTVKNVTISSTSVRADNITQYDIIVTGTDLGVGGGNKISQEYALINLLGGPPNQGLYRGYLTWGIDNYWPGAKNNQACAGGGYAGIQAGSGYGDSYLHMDSCASSVVGNDRVITFKVHFDPSFGVVGPLTNNDISGHLYNSDGSASGWVNFNINFGLIIPTITATPGSISVGQNENATWSGSIKNTDWIGLYRQGEADGAWIQWRQANSLCSQNSTGTLAPSGNCGFTIDSPGTYEFRFFANGTWNKIATSNTFTVSAPLAPTVEITCGSPATQSCSIPYNTGTRLDWSSTNSTSCTLYSVTLGIPTGYTGMTGTNIPTGNLTSNTSYRIDCGGPGGNVSDTVNITVGAAPACPASGSNTVILSPRILNVGETATMSAPAGFSPGTFVSNNTAVATVLGNIVTARSPGVALISGTGWTFSNGATGCKLGGPDTVASTCPVGETGTPPTCSGAAGICSPGYTGTPPTCVADGGAALTVRRIPVIIEN